MARVGRPVFKRGLEYVAVRPIKMTSKHTVQPGEPVMLPTYRLRSLYQRRRIGPKGHPWTEQALASQGFPMPFVSDNAPPPENTETFEDEFPITTETGARIDAGMFADFVTNRSGDMNALAEMDDNAKQEMLGEMVAELDAPAAQVLAAAENGGSSDETPAEASPVELVKIGSQWGYPDLTAKKFRTKKAAKQWLREQTATEEMSDGRP